MNFETGYPSCFLDCLVQWTGEAKHILVRERELRAVERIGNRSVNFLDIRNSSLSYNLLHYGCSCSARNPVITAYTAFLNSEMVASNSRFGGSGLANNFTVAALTSVIP